MYSLTSEVFWAGWRWLGGEGAPPCSAAGTIYQPAQTQYAGRFKKITSFFLSKIIYSEVFNHIAQFILLLLRVWCEYQSWEQTTTVATPLYKAKQLKMTE